MSLTPLTIVLYINYTSSKKNKFFWTKVSGSVINRRKSACNVMQTKMVSKDRQTGKVKVSQRVEMIKKSNKSNRKNLFLNYFNLILVLRISKIVK